MLWGALTEPVPVREAAWALLGLSSEFTGRRAGRSIATSSEAATLLAEMPEILRNLSITTEQTAERCQGEIRGPVLWSETMAARAGTAGSTDVFVCLTARRAYDTPANRVLVAALTEIRRAAAAADPVEGGVRDDAAITEARRVGDEARRYLEHRTLRDVSRKRPSRRDVAAASRGRRNQRYRPALALLSRVRTPLGLADLLAFGDARTARQHRVVVALASGLHRLGTPLGRPRVTPGGELRAGRLVYRHPEVARATGNPLHGIVVDRLLIDVPDPTSDPDPARAADALAARSHGRTPVLITGPADIDRAVRLLHEAGG